MASRLVSLENSTAVLSVEVPVEALPPFLQAAAAHLAETAKLAGFRPGKAPYDLVKQRLGEAAIYQAASEKIVAKTFTEAVREHNLTTLGPPEITVHKLAPDNPIVYEAKVALMPQVHKFDYAKLNSKRATVSVADSDVTKTIEDLRRMRATEAAVDRPAQTGDRLEIDFRLFQDNVPVDGGQSERFPISLGENQLIPGFEDQLIGLKANDEKNFTLTMPKDSRSKNLAGQPVECQVKVRQVFEVTLPELTDAFAQSLGTFKDAAELRAKLKDNLTQERTETAERDFETTIMDELLGRAKFDALPELLMHVEESRLLRELKDDIERRGMKWPDYLQNIKQDEAALKKELGPTAERRIKSALLLRTIAEWEDLTVSDTEIDAEVQARLGDEARDRELAQELSSSEFRESLSTFLRNRKTLDLLKHKTTTP